MEGIFFKNRKEYTNQLNPLKGYIEQLTQYISVKKQLSIEDANKIATKFVKEHFKDKPIKYFERKENGDRVVKDGTLYRYIKENIDNKNILVPTFTSYVNSKVEKSLLSEFIFINVKKRSIAKKAGQKAKAEGNKDLATAKDNEQNMMKIYNNSLSGVFGQEACILHNPTAHNTLTSITRTITSLSNASNEKLIAGNRYLPRPIDVLNSIIYISTYTNEEQIKSIVTKYNLHLPTIEETVSVLKYSSDLYFSDINYYNKHIIPYLSGLSPYKLAGICYIGDLYHIRRFNSTFIKQIMSELIHPVNSNRKLDDITPIHKVEESILNFTHTVLYSSVKGYGKDYEKMNEDNIASLVLDTSKHIISSLTKYKDFFNTFFMTEIFPTNSHRLSNLRRRVVVLSDTDSTCFTLDEWITWYKGKYFVDDESIGLAGCLTYIASQAIVNSLAVLSKNMNIEEDLLNTLAMKSEYLWRLFIPTTVSKHYFAETIIQEGNVFEEPETERKGVHLKNSAVPKIAVDHGNGLMDYILKKVANNEKVSLKYVLDEIKKMEYTIIDSVKKGESIYLKKSKIKSKEAYSQDETKSPYQRHQFWIDVFEPKYGSIGDTPYDVVKIPTTIVSRPLLVDWLNSIEDIELRTRLFNWLEKYNKKDLPTIYLNESYVQGNGVPKEIADIIDIKRIVFDTTMQHRLILETLGVFVNEELLISEQFNV